MKLHKVPALVLALGLQVVPVCRLACVTQTAAPTGFAIVFRWIVGAVALLGTVHAVSGASAAIAGVANTNPPDATTAPALGPLAVQAGRITPRSARRPATVTS